MCGDETYLWITLKARLVRVLSLEGTRGQSGVGGLIGGCYKGVEWGLKIEVSVRVVWRCRGVDYRRPSGRLLTQLMVLG